MEYVYGVLLSYIAVEVDVMWSMFMRYYRVLLWSIVEYSCSMLLWSSVVGCGGMEYCRVLL